MYLFHWKFVLYYINFESINRDIFGIIHAIIWIISSLHIMYFTSLDR